MIRPWVKASLYQYEELKRLREKKGRSLSQIIRETVSEFLKKKDFPTDIALSFLARVTRNWYQNASCSQISALVDLGSGRKRGYSYPPFFGPHSNTIPGPVFGGGRLTIRIDKLNKDHRIF